MRMKAVQSSLGIFVLMFDPDGVVGSQVGLVLQRYDPIGVTKQLENENEKRFNHHYLLFSFALSHLVPILRGTHSL